MRKAVIQNRMALDILTAAQWGTCTIIKAECCLYIPDLSGNVSTALEDMQNQVKAMSNENISFWKNEDESAAAGGNSPCGEDRKTLLNNRKAFE